MKMSKSHISLGGISALLLTLLIAPQSSTGRVFERWRTTGGIRERMAHTGATELLSGNIAINDGSGTVNVFGIEEPLAKAWRGIMQANGLTPSTPAGTMAFSRTVNNNMVVALLGLQLPDRNRTLLFTLQQSAHEAERSRNVPQTHRLNNLPVYHNSQPEFFASHDETRFKLEISRSTDAAEIIRLKMDASLRGQGWLRISPAHEHNLPSLLAYGRENESCWLFVAPAGTQPAPATTIAIIHKRSAGRIPVF